LLFRFGFNSSPTTHTDDFGEPTGGADPTSFTGLNIRRNDNGSITINQPGYIRSMVDRFINDRTPKLTPAHLNFLKAPQDCIFE
jgi:hypothetical protein